MGRSRAPLTHDDRLWQGCPPARRGMGDRETVPCGADVRRGGTFKRVCMGIAPARGWGRKALECAGGIRPIIIGDGGDREPVLSERIRQANESADTDAVAWIEADMWTIAVSVAGRPGTAIMRYRRRAAPPPCLSTDQSKLREEP